MDIREQAITAAKKINELFLRNALPPVPEDATLESLWHEIQVLKGNVRSPKRVDVIKMLLEDPQLTGLSVPLLADIIRQVYAKHKAKCDTTPSSIRWYISQKTLEWDIKARDKSPVDVKIEDF